MFTMGRKQKKGLSLGSPGMLRGRGILHGVEIHRVGVKVTGEGVESTGGICTDATGSTLARNDMFVTR